MKPCYLYKIINSVNGKVYIGITNNPRIRKNQHWNFENRFNGKTINILYQAMRKYGLENFSFEVICVGCKNYILDLEIKAIKLYKTTEKKFGYNIKPGGESGRGYSVTDTPRDIPVFVSGFWFPNRRTATSKLNITINIYKNRQRSGTLGDVCRRTDRIGKQSFKRLGAIKYKPCYVSGFWFPDIQTACGKLNRTESVIRARLLRGSIEEGKRKVNQDGENNHMFGINPEDHPSAKIVVICGIEYGSIKQAVADTGYSKYIITSRIKQNHPDFKFKNEEEINNEYKISRQLQP